MKDDIEAVKWYQKAAEQNQADAQYNLGRMYAEGRGVENDFAIAASWWRRAAISDRRAQFNLAELYANGKGVNKDEQEATMWYLKAADQNDPDALYRLGEMYANGRGVKKDDAEAARYYHKAAGRDNSDAQYRLAEMYAGGRGVEKNEVEAYAWANLSARTSADAAKLRDTLEKTMTSLDVSAAQDRTRELRMLLTAPVDGSAAHTKFVMAAAPDQGQLAVAKTGRAESRLTKPMRTFVSERFGFELSYPSAWRSEQRPDTELFISRIYAPGVIATLSASATRYSGDSGQIEAAFKERSDRTVDLLTASARQRFPDFKVLEHKPTVLGSFPAYIIEGSYSVRNPASIYKSRAVIVAALHNSFIYRIHFEATESEFEGARSEMNLIFSTFNYK